MAAEIAAEYARDGESLDTFLHDLRVCLSVVGLASPGSATLRSTSIAWADAYSARYHSITCIHEGSGLHSVHHLQSHVRVLLESEPSRASGAHPRRPTTYALLVAELPPALVTPPHVAMLRDELIAQTPPGTVISSLSGRRCAALLRRTPAASELAGRLDRSLTDLMGVNRDGHRLRVWIEGLPQDVETASQLLAELAR